MTLPEEYRPCRICGALCDGDLCSDACESRAWLEKAEQAVDDELEPYDEPAPDEDEEES